MGASLKVGITPATATESDILTALCNLECGDILVINDIHLLQNGPRVTLCQAMETFHLRVTLTLDGSPRPVDLNLPMFTLIGTAPSRDSVSQKLLARFPLVEAFPPYTPQNLADMAVRFASALDTRLDPEAARQLAAASGGAPRDVLKLVRRVQGYALVKAPGADITPELATQALDLFAPWEQLDQYREPQETGPVRTPIPAEVRRAVWRRDQGKCTRCGSREKLEFDHIVPVSRGGSNTARNIELLCEPCNRSKSATIE
jgi:Holliday junction resolvasome RuvABC ATP-dependent DNA helicase subunit